MAGGGEASGATAAGDEKVACAAWIRHQEEKATHILAAYGRVGAAASPPAVEVLGFDPKDCSLSFDPLARVVVGDGAGNAPRGIVVHPNGDELVCATAEG